MIVFLFEKLRVEKVVSPEQKFRMTSASRVRRRTVYRTRLVWVLYRDSLLKTFGHEL
jgi:hypothetical protein